MFSEQSQSSTVQPFSKNAPMVSIDGEVLSVRVIDDLYSLLLNEHPDKSKQEFLQGIIENNLLAKEALKTSTLDQLLVESPVASNGYVAIDNQVVTYLQAIFGQELLAHMNALPDHDFSSVILSSYNMVNNKQPLVEILTLKNRMNYAFNAEQRQHAEKLTLMHYKFSNDVRGEITLLDIYNTQNIQGRVKLHQLDFDYLALLLQRKLESLYVLFWADVMSGYSQSDLQTLQSIVQNKIINEKFMPTTAMYADIHASNPSLKALAKQVTTAQIDAYYKNNPTEFEVVEQVKARHIQCQKQSVCQQAYKAIIAGMSFRDAVVAYSDAEDRLHREPGSLGLIKRISGQLPWLSQVALIQKSGVMTKPMRSPTLNAKSAVWEIVIVDERIDGMLPVDSESVRYIASYAVARQMAADGFKRLKADLMSNAKIIIDQEALKKPVKASVVPLKTSSKVLPERGGHHH